MAVALSTPGASRPDPHVFLSPPPPPHPGPSSLLFNSRLPALGLLALHGVDVDNQSCLRLMIDHLQKRPVCSLGQGAHRTGEGRPQRGGVWLPQPQMQHLSDFSGIPSAQPAGRKHFWRHHITHSTADVLKRAPQSPAVSSPNLKVRCTVLCVDSSAASSCLSACLTFHWVGI